MELYELDDLVNTLANFGIWVGRLQRFPDQFIDFRKQDYELQLNHAAACVRLLEKVDLSTSLKFAQRLEKLLVDDIKPLPTDPEIVRLDWPGPRNFRELCTNLLTTLHYEIEGKLVFSVSSGAAKYYNAPLTVFGKAVVDAFDKHLEDMMEAGNCFAVARYTASVFHVMRLLEVAVQQFAGLLGVTPIDSRGKGKNWQNFLDEANAAVRARDQNNALTKSYAAISAHLYNVKLAFRNEVMHPKETYTEDQARDVLSTMRIFLTALVGVLPVSSGPP